MNFLLAFRWARITNMRARNTSGNKHVDQFTIYNTGRSSFFAVFFHIVYYPSTLEQLTVFRFTVGVISLLKTSGFDSLSLNVAGRFGKTTINR